MPTYDYVCDACEHQFELFQPITAEPVKKCPECGSPYMVEKWLKAGPVWQCPNAECKHKQPAPQPAPTTPANAIGTIDNSPDTARLVVIGSAEFLNDVVFQLSSNLTRDRYLNTLQFMQNTVDWSVEDLDLLTQRMPKCEYRDYLLNEVIAEARRLAK